jgi:hypothetical protein
MNCSSSSGAKLPKSGASLQCIINDLEGVLGGIYDISSKRFVRRVEMSLSA